MYKSKWFCVKVVTESYTFYKQLLFDIQQLLNIKTMYFINYPIKKLMTKVKGQIPGRIQRHGWNQSSRLKARNYLTSTALSLRIWMTIQFRRLSCRRFRHWFCLIRPKHRYCTKFMHFSIVFAFLCHDTKMNGKMQRFCGKFIYGWIRFRH